MIWSLILPSYLANQSLTLCSRSTVILRAHHLSCWLSPWWLCDVPQQGICFPFFAWHLMCTFNLRRHGLYWTWGNFQLSSFPTLLICHSLNSLLFGCPWVCTEGSHPVCLRAALSIFIFMYYVMVDSCKSFFRYPFSFLFNLSSLFLISSSLPHPVPPSTFSFSPLVYCHAYIP